MGEMRIDLGLVKTEGDLTEGELMALKVLLEKFIGHMESIDLSEESHPLIRSTHNTYAFVNAIAEHQGV